MTLNQNDAELFYELWFPLLDYTNKKYKVNANLRKMHGVKELDPNEVKIVADYLWGHTDVIEEYLADHMLSDDHRSIVSGWKKCISGQFMLERHLKKGSVFISTDTEEVYMGTSKNPLKIRSKCSAGIEIATFATTLSKHR